ncbi:MAG: diaminopimelate decarboxylase [Betaproteobacteria bacterium]|jgi:diaminopimelate decarboxylase|nr:diaminopimelate decarboxylase [Betaproteobacteria bacterium]
MSPFAYRNGILCAEEVPLPRIAADHGTPCYVYSRAALLSRFDAFRQALAGRDALICYAVKANSNLAILNQFARAGAGFDIVSGGELARVLAAGGDPAKVVFSGVGKTIEEMRQALATGIFCFNVESAEELGRLNELAGQSGKKAPIAIRVNPDVDPKTHPYISTGLRSNKFGVAYGEAFALYLRARALPHVDIAGIACHIGSQLLDPAPAAEAAGKILVLADRLADAGIPLRHLDLGGGIGIRYRDETPPAIADYLAPILAQLAGRKEKILFEPGRALVGNAGILLTRIEYLKHGEEKNFAIVDAAMNDLMRPALYDAWHDILPVRQNAGTEAEYEVVGPVCESGDFLGHARRLAVETGDLLAILSAGAYGMVMSSNYNTRPRAAEIIVDGAQAFLVRRRENTEQLFALETVID